MTHPSESRTLKRLTAVLVGAVVIAALYLARDVLIPFALALLFAFLLNPLVAWIERKGLWRVPSVLLVMTLFLAAVGGTAWIVANQLIAVVNKLPEYRSNLHQKIEILRNRRHAGLGKTADTVKQLDNELSSASSELGTSRSQAENRGASRATPAPVPVVVEPPSGALSEAERLFGPLVAPLATALIVVALLAFMLTKREDLRNRLLRLSGKRRLNVATQALDEAASRVSRFLLTQFSVNVLYGAAVATGLYFIRVPDPILWGALATLLRFIPYIGTFIAALLPVSLALAVFSGWIHAGLALSVFVILELVIANFVEPLLYGTQTGISALAILVSAMFWSLLWGPIGLILATPLTVCLLVLARFVPALSFLPIILGDDEVLPPEALFYQRLLAMDRAEAKEIGDKYIADNSLVQLYEKVVIPSLSMAEVDRHDGALEEERESFILRSAREMIEELGESASADMEEPTSNRLLPVKIVCLPARDEADGITATILRQMLESCGLSGTQLPYSTFVGEMIQQISQQSVSIACICALPPFALAHARGLCKRLHVALPNVRIVVGVWGSEGTDEAMKEEMKRTGAQVVVSTLSEAVDGIRQLADAAILQDPAA